MTEKIGFRILVNSLNDLLAEPSERVPARSLSTSENQVHLSIQARDRDMLEAFHYHLTDGFYPKNNPIHLGAIRKIVEKLEARGISDPHSYITHDRIKAYWTVQDHLFESLIEEGDAPLIGVLHPEAEQALISMATERRIIWWDEVMEFLDQLNEGSPALKEGTL